MKTLIEKANILTEALPYIKKLSGKTVVVKYGGNAMKDESLTKTILQDIATLKYVGVNPILVHGGGPEINHMLSQLHIESQFHNGLRITDKPAMDVVQMVLGGKLNKNLTAQLNLLDVTALGLCGKDAQLIRVTKKQSDVDLGYVGEIQSVNTEFLKLLMLSGVIPVIASIGVDDKGESYNINADTVASAIATALQAEKLMFLTDIDGVRLVENDPETLISVMTVAEAEEYIANGVIHGGMLPKVKACIDCIHQGIHRVHIINGTIRHPILLEIFTDKGIGTMFVKE